MCLKLRGPIIFPLGRRISPVSKSSAFSMSSWAKASCRVLPFRLPAITFLRLSNELKDPASSSSPPAILLWLSPINCHDCVFLSWLASEFYKIVNWSELSADSFKLSPSLMIMKPELESKVFGLAMELTFFSSPVPSASSPEEASSMASAGSSSTSQSSQSSSLSSCLSEFNLTFLPELI